MPAIDEALRDPALLGAALGDWRSWSTWLAVLRAAFGLSLDAQQRQAFTNVAGNRSIPTRSVRELWAIVGRRAGKSRMAAAVAVYLACFVKHRLAAGERGMVLVLSGTTEQSRTVFDYARAFLEESPILQKEIESYTRTEIRLRNGIVIAIHSNSFRHIRGRTLCACVFDEVAVWRDESFASPDIEVFRSVKPMLSTTKGMLVGISTGYRRVGLLFQKHRDHFGQDSATTLVVQGSTQAFNGTIDEAEIAEQVAADPAAARAEWYGEFRDDLATFLSDDLIDAAIEPDRPLEVPPRDGVIYHAFTDAAAGASDRGDAYTIAIGHHQGGNFQVDVVRGVLGRFDPHAVTEQFAALCRQYRIRTVVGDNYASQWVREVWLKVGMDYQLAALPKGQIYMECLPLFARRVLRLPDHQRMIRELRLLERSARVSGREHVDHAKGGHDDFANVCCGVLWRMAKIAAEAAEVPIVMPGVINADGSITTPSGRSLGVVQSGYGEGASSTWRNYVRADGSISMTPLRWP
jgi:hypothetical protein